jgi:hypothetical protein
MQTISYILVAIIAVIFLYTGYYGCDCYKKEGFEGGDEENVNKLNAVEKKMSENIDKIQIIGKQNSDLLDKMNNDTKTMLKTLNNL